MQIYTTKIAVAMSHIQHFFSAEKTTRNSGIDLYQKKNSKEKRRIMYF